MLITAYEHLDWCIERAMMRRNAGRTKSAVDGFLEDVDKHAGTKWLASNDVTIALLLGNVHDPIKFREALESLRR